MNIDFDLTELLQLGDDLEAAARQVVSEVRPVVVKGAVKVKAAMQADMAESGHFGQAASSISFDMSGNAGYAEAQIGPVKGGAGSLANLAYFGGANGGGGTVRDPQEALDDEADPFAEALGELIDGLLS